VIVLGVDPGSAATGYGIISGDAPGAAHLLECGVIRTDTSLDLASRLEVIFDGMTSVIERHRPDCLAVESAFYARNVRTTLVLGHARGVILLAARINHLAIYEYPPAEIKKAIVGTGAATKQQVQFMVARLLRLKQAPQPADAADGVAAALAHLNGARLRELLAESRGDSVERRAAGR
jgi:crossover junction endodeoxyribonuclease RuvC